MKKRLMITVLLGVLAACVESPSPAPLMVGDKLMVDHKIIVPAGGILFANGAMIGGVQ